MNSNAIEILKEELKWFREEFAKRNSPNKQAIREETYSELRDNINRIRELFVGIKDHHLKDTLEEAQIDTQKTLQRACKNRRKREKEQRRLQMTREDYFSSRFDCYEMIDCISSLDSLIISQKKSNRSYFRQVFMENRMHERKLMGIADMKSLLKLLMNRYQHQLFVTYCHCRKLNEDRDIQSAKLNELSVNSQEISFSNASLEIYLNEMLRKNQFLSEKLNSCKKQLRDAQVKQEQYSRSLSDLPFKIEINKQLCSLLSDLTK